MTRTTRLCIVASAAYIAFIVTLVIVVPRMVANKTPEPDLSLCPFCHK